VAGSTVSLWYTAEVVEVEDFEMDGVKTYKVLATKCGSCDCGCPTVLESDSTDELVVVGKIDELVMRSTEVQAHTGDGEVAVVIPRSLLIEAAKALRG
jgi:hypothetical protein